MKFCSALLILFIVSCTNTAPLVLDTNESIIIDYGFNDSSVSPEYHRSYTITISPTNIHVQVDSYGDVLADKNLPISSNQFEELIQTINEANLVSGRNEPADPCDGGTSESLTIKAADKQVYNGYFDHCADAPSDSMGNIELVMDAIHELVPNLGEMLQ